MKPNYIKTNGSPNATPVIFKKVNGELEVTFDLQSILQVEDKSSKEDSEILKRIVLGRGLHYYLSRDERFASGRILLELLYHAAQDLHEISNNVYFSNRVLMRGFKESKQLFDSLLHETIDLVNSVEGGREYLNQEAGVNIDQIKKVLSKPKRRKRISLVLRLFL